MSALPQVTLWRAFVCAVVATMTLQYMDPFKSGKVVLFQVQSAGQVWRAFELVPWAFLGLCGGLFGAAFIRMCVALGHHDDYGLCDLRPIVATLNTRRSGDRPL